MNTSNEATWIRICQMEEIPILGSRIVEGGIDNIAVFRTASNQVFALLDRCHHKGGPLSQGIVHGETVTCPLHGLNIDLSSGEVKAPDEGCAKRFPVKLENGEVFLQLMTDSR